MDNKELTIKISERIKPLRKRTERIVGFVPYTLNFEMRRYTGTSKKSEKVSLLDKTIMHLIGKGLTNITDIAESLGLDLADEIEKDIINTRIDDLKTRLQLIQGSGYNIKLTPAGCKFIEKGECIKYFTGHFEIYIDPDHLDFHHLMDCVDKIGYTKTEQRPSTEIKLETEQIKAFAEHQASFIQFAENGTELLYAKLDAMTTAKMSFYVCFLQSIRDNSVRTIVYDDLSDTVIPEMSQLFDCNEDLRDDLLKKCLKLEVQSDRAVKVESGVKTKEQSVREAKIIKEADDKGEELTQSEYDNYENKVGSVFESEEFEKELDDIFENGKNDEIWLISPWIRRYAFQGKREPLIRKFLDQGGAIFIGYSEPENAGAEMVDLPSMSIVNKLNSFYDKFYFAELPKFHYKNVITQSRDLTSLYTGSFNILSFCINGNEEHYRKEQMTFVNRKEAKQRRQDYLQQFVAKYINEYIKKITTSPSGSSINISKLEYLKRVVSLDDNLAKLETLANELNLEITSVSQLDEQGLIALANTVLKSQYKYKDDKYFIQAMLAAMLFLFEIGKERKDHELQRSVESELLRALNEYKNGIFKICRFKMRPGRIDSKKSIVNIVCNDFNFEFGEISLPYNIFHNIKNHKEEINFKGSTITYAKTIIRELLYNSSKPLNMVD